MFNAGLSLEQMKDLLGQVLAGTAKMSQIPKMVDRLKLQGQVLLRLGEYVNAKGGLVDFRKIWGPQFTENYLTETILPMFPSGWNKKREVPSAVYKHLDLLKTAHEVSQTRESQETKDELSSSKEQLVILPFDLYDERISEKEAVERGLHVMKKKKSGTKKPSNNRFLWIKATTKIYLAYGKQFNLVMEIPQKSYIDRWPSFRQLTKGTMRFSNLTLILLNYPWGFGVADWDETAWGTHAIFTALLNMIRKLTFPENDKKNEICYTFTSRKLVFVSSTYHICCYQYAY